MSAAGASFVLPPMTRTADVAALEAWIGDAEAGERILVAEGRVKPVSALAWLMVEQWQRAGFVELLALPGSDGSGQRWVAQRAACAVPGTVPAARKSGRAVEPLAPDGEPASECILRAIKRAANMGQAAPSLSELAKIAGLKSGANAKYYVDKLKRRGAIGIEAQVVPGGERRRFEILDVNGFVVKRTGWRS